jgi:hypothetical protein
MNINEFKDLEVQIKKQDFNKSYKTINRVLFFLSIFGNIASIFLAFFFISKIITGAVSETNQTAVLIVSVILLSGLELLKRDIFDKFSMEYLRHRDFMKKEVLNLVIFSVCVVSFSFYSSLSGAKEFSSKAVLIEQQTKDNIKVYEDSLTTMYGAKITDVEKEIKDAKSKIEVKDKEQTDLESQVQLTYQQKQRVRDLKKEKELLRNEIAADDLKITSIKSELSKEIATYEEEQNKESNSKKTENTNNSFLFVVISTLIELVILIGVYFNKYYKWRSYSEMKQKLDRDPNYQKWVVYNTIIDIIYLNETKINDKMPSNKVVAEMCRTNGVILLNKDVQEFTKLLISLKVLRVSGSARYYAKDKETANEIIKSYFNIS